MASAWMISCHGSFSAGCRIQSFEPSGCTCGRCQQWNSARSSISKLKALRPNEIVETARLAVQHEVAGDNSCRSVVVKVLDGLQLTPWALDRTTLDS